MATAVAALRQRLELVVLAVLVLGAIVVGRVSSGRGIPSGIYGVGVIAGAAVALQAVGIVLVYRANRIINFAQVAVGAVGAVLFFQLVARRTLLLPVHMVCPSCFDMQRVSRGEDSFDYPVNVPGWLVDLNFAGAVVVSLLVVVLLSYGGYALVIRRFADSSKLIGTVASLGLAEVYALIADMIPTKLFRQESAVTGTVPLPFDWSFDAGGVRFGSTAILTAGIAVVAFTLLTLFFTRTAMGVVLRGAAENPQRAETLGVNLAAVTSVVWIAAGMLSGIAAMLAATESGLAATTVQTRLLACAVVGAMLSIPVTVAAAIAFGIVDQAVLWMTRSTAAIDGLVLLIVVSVLLVQRSRSGRADTEDGGWKAAREVRPIPPELARLEMVRRWLRFGRIAGIAVVLGLPWLLSPGQTNLAAVTVIYGIVALSLLVLTGWAGQISLGQFGFAAIGAWVTAVLDWPFPVGLIAGGLAGAAASIVVGLPALRLKGLHLAITTLAFAAAVNALLLNPTYLGRHLPQSLARPSVLGLALEDQRTFFYFALAFLAVAIGAVMGMRRSRSARILIAARDNEPGAQSFGINLLRARLAAFAVSGFVAAFAGGLFAYSQYGVSVTAFTPDTSIKMFLTVVIGGLGSIAGPLIGAAYIGAADIYAQGGGNQALLAQAVTGVGVVGLLLFAPGGLGDVVFKVRDGMLRRVAERYRVAVPSLLADRARGGLIPIAPVSAPMGGTGFVPERYRARGQWAYEARTRRAYALVKDKADA